MSESTSEFPVSYAQRGLWFLNRLDPTSAAYNVPVLVRLDGPLDAPALEAALADVRERHEPLRTVLGERDGEPCQRVLSVHGSGFVFKHLDTDPERAEGLLRELAEQPFDLDGDLPVRAFLVRTGPEAHVLALVMHHVVCDGWSFAPLLRDLAAAYDARHAGRAPDWEPLPVRYSDYTLWQRDLLADGDDPNGLLAAQLGYWRDALAGVPEELALPTDRVRPPVASGRGAVVTRTIAPELHTGLRAIARQSRGTLFTVAQAAVAALLHRLGSGTDIPLGTAVAGRTDEALDDLVGMFVNTQVLRADLSGDPTFLDLAQRVTDVGFSALAHQELPFDRIVEELNPVRSRARHPLFQVAVELHDGDESPLRLTGLTATVDVVQTSTAKFDLAWDFVETSGADGRPGSLTLHLSHATDLFDRETAEDLATRLVLLLGAVVTDPLRPVSGIPLVDDAERRALLADFRPPHPDLEHGVVERIRAHATARPDAVAVVDGSGPTDYRTLVGRASRLTRTLADAGVTGGTIVPVLARRGAPVIAGFLGITAAGGVYLPLDPKAPAARTLALLDDADCRHLLADAAHADAARALAEAADRPIRVLVIGEEADAPDDLAPVSGGPDDPAYVIFTSGSTGKPKGALVQRRGMVNNLLAEAEAMGIDGPLTVTSTAPLTFDISVWQMFVPLIFGGTVRALPDETVRDPRALFRLVADERVDVTQVVPSLLHAALDEWDHTGESPALALRCLAVTGEALPADLCHRWAALHPAIPLVNCYGPTECSDDVTQAVITADNLPTDSRTPIGRPVRGSRLLVLDDRLALTPTGIPGELWIGGIVVGGGYLGDPRRTAATFVADPWAQEPGTRMYRTGDLVRRRRDGQLEYLGRRDHQVKVRGHRIEPGEIEHALRALPGVRAAAVIVREDTPGDKRLVGYVVPAADGPADHPTLRAELGRTLPEYMVPAAFVTLDALPLTPNGKLDRRGLPVPDLTALSTGRPPATDREKTVAALFADLLGVPEVSLDDDFFAFGGHSLMATRLVVRLRSALGLDVPIRLVFEAPTVAGLLAALDRDVPATATARPRLGRRRPQG
ncbi:amino acid adenylation domain-containing protein [Streptomyces sp. NBC_01351]|uniref:non-ribosomal peptide synthetase n=1 Tax=Streptomyces sp. NBC_01351 TaxID=2903833 RepID=UPI002E31B4A8|nr:amino acid adenylation domain-containing protein [Streptomyces sp. NBC_01351]